MFDYNYDFSIVMGYYNRKKQIINTLNYFEKTYQNYNYEVIIVDDNSTIEHALDDILVNYSFTIKYIKISKEEKGNRINPCIPYNKGIRESSGKIIILQNPECIHVGNLLKFLKNNLNSHDYLAFSCYNCFSKELTDELLDNPKLINDIDYNNRNKNQWYNHPRYRPVHYHFCAAMMNDNMKILGGFDERFSKGHSYDDNEILLSIEKNLKLNIKTIPPDYGLVIHQWHSRDSENRFSNTEFQNLVNYNKILYSSYLYNHNRTKFNFPKILHLYWDLSNFSFLNLLTILSFKKYHFGWKINIYCPINPNKNKSWATPEQKDEYIGKNYFEYIKNIDNVNIHHIDFDNLNFDHKDASEVIKSDYFRLFILEKYGGLWSDFDIIYTGNIEHIYNNITNKNMVLYKYKWKELNRNVYPVGLFLCNKNNSIVRIILENINSFYNNKNYQCLGAHMFHNIFENKNMRNILSKMKLNELIMHDANIYLPLKWNELDKLYTNKEITLNKLKQKNKFIGIHWFNGAKISKDYANNLNIQTLKNRNSECLMDELIKIYI